MQSSVSNNNNAYNKQAAAAAASAAAVRETRREDPRNNQRSDAHEESKPYEMNDFYQYSEKLRRARGISGASPRPPDFQSQPASSRSSGSRTPSSPAVSIEGSRSGSPYTAAPQGKWL